MADPKRRPIWEELIVLRIILFRAPIHNNIYERYGLPVPWLDRATTVLELHQFSANEFHPRQFARVGPVNGIESDRRLTSMLGAHSVPSPLSTSRAKPLQGTLPNFVMVQISIKGEIHA